MSVAIRRDGLTPYVDMHCDTLLELYKCRLLGEEQALEQNALDNDLRKMRQGGCLLQNFAIAIMPYSDDNPEFSHLEFWWYNNEQGKWLPPTPIESCLRVCHLFDRLMRENSRYIAPVYSYSDIAKNRDAGKISAMLTIEGGEVAMGSLEILDTLFKLGVRMFGFTWNYRNCLAYPNLDLPFDGSVPNVEHVETENGLTELGVAFVERMEQLGMIPDVSHLSDAGFYDVLAHTKKPFVASHSNARAVCCQPRNLTDDMIRKLAERGGVSGINFGGLFVREPRRSTVSDLVAHIQHFVKVGGIGCVGLGSDFDGIGGDKSLNNASYMQELAWAMRKAGFSDDEVDKVFFENVLRVYRDTLPA